MPVTLFKLTTRPCLLKLQATLQVGIGLRDVCERFDVGENLRWGSCCHLGLLTSGNIDDGSETAFDKFDFGNR